MNLKYYSVAVEAPLPRKLTYAHPEQLAAIQLSRGCSVKVPLGKRMASGVIIGPSDFSEDGFKIKPISEVIEERPILPEAFVKWTEWLAEYYMHPLGQVFSSAFPPLKKNSKHKPRREVVPSVELSERPRLTEEQSAAVEAIESTENFKAHLIHGVTGSGKTEIYLHAIETVIAKGKVALVLVPEISLTPQLVQRFAARFPGEVSVLHSHLTEREKTNQWWQVVEGKTKVLIGARSALFCPIANLGIVVVDEEHESSFKQEEKLKYHARDAAIMRAKLADCPILLGSATPSLESWKNASSGKYGLIQLRRRVANRRLPSVQIVDLKHEKDVLKQQPSENDSRPFWMSPQLHEELASTMNDGYQAALFLNRRGVAQMAVCRACGHTYECPNCSISLTLHGKSHLVCHYCDYSERLADNCPACDQAEIETVGLGTEQIEISLREMFPDKTIARADRDEITNRADLENLVEQMEKAEIDLLVGTQMIAKGLDFPRLMLVGLVLADIGMNMPDFRASEKSFQLLTQVSGRAGRHSEDGGKVVIQTFNPKHLSLVKSQTADFEGFAEVELEERRALNYPPFGKLAMIKMTAKSFEKAEQLGELVRKRAGALKQKYPQYENIQLLGPCPAPLAKIRNSYRYQLLLKAPLDGHLQAFCQQFLSEKKWVPSGTKVQIDIDPLSML